MRTTCASLEGRAGTRGEIAGIGDRGTAAGPPGSNLRFRPNRRPSKSQRAAPRPATGGRARPTSPVILLDPRSWTLAAARSLRAAGAPVVVLSGNPFRTGSLHEGVQGHRLPPLRSRPERWSARLLELAARWNPAVVYACSEPAVEFVRARRKELAPHYTLANITSIETNPAVASADVALRHSLLRATRRSKCRWRATRRVRSPASACWPGRPALRRRPRDERRGLGGRGAELGSPRSAALRRLRALHLGARPVRTPDLQVASSVPGRASSSHRPMASTSRRSPTASRPGERPAPAGARRAVAPAADHRSEGCSEDAPRWLCRSASRDATRSPGCGILRGLLRP